MAQPQLISFALGIAHWLIIVAALFVVPVNRKPSSATAWLMLIAIVPLFGVLLFVLIGSPKLPRGRRAMQRTMDTLIAEAVARRASEPALAPYLAPELLPRFEPYARLGHALGGMPAFAGNCVEPIPDYSEVFRRMALDIDAAAQYVHIQFYILTKDAETAPVFAALERARGRGVKVRILLDDVGSRKFPTDKPTMVYFEQQGFEYRRMLPFDLFDGQWLRPDLRNHRKIVVIDGMIGYTGSLNMIKRDYFRKDGMYYDELVMRTSGPVVAQLAAIFVTDWYCETGVLLSPQNAPETVALPRAVGDVLCQALPSGSGHDDENNLKLFTTLIHGARRRLIVVNPYFVPDDALMLAICSAAQRGVEVTMINSEAPDQFMVFHAQRSFYAELLRCGVEIRLYKRPVLLHSKFMLIDDDIAMVGSSNFDMRSFHLNLEVSLVYYNPDIVARLDHEVVQDYVQRSIPVTLETWTARPARKRLFENMMRLTAALQ